jgi:hypothetical protein
MFAAQDVPSLRKMVGEAHSPSLCEFAQVEHSEFFSGHPGGQDVRLPLDEVSDWDDAPGWPDPINEFDAAEPTECFAHALSDPYLTWLPLDETASSARPRKVIPCFGFGL